MIFQKPIRQTQYSLFAQWLRQWWSFFAVICIGASRLQSIARAAALLAFAIGVYGNPAMAQLRCDSVYAVSRDYSQIWLLDEDGQIMEMHETFSPGVNPFGISSDGVYAYLGRQSTTYDPTGKVGEVVVYNTVTRTVEAISPPAVARPEMHQYVAGAVNPVNGWFYMAAGSSNSALDIWHLYAFNPKTVNVAPVYIGPITNAAGRNGDMAFDSMGTLYLVTGAPAMPAPNSFIYRVGQVPVSASEEPMPATLITAIDSASGGTMYGTAFNSSGQLVVGAGASFEWFDPLTGQRIKSNNDGSAGLLHDLASCAQGNTVSVRKFLPDGRVSDTDQFTLEISGGGLPGIGAEEGLSATTSGNSAGMQAETIGPLLVLDGTQLTINEVAAGSTNLDDYTRSWLCIDEANNDAEVGSGNSLPGTFTMPTPDPEKGANVVCTIRNEVFEKPTLRLYKSLPNGRKTRTDQFTLQIAQGGTLIDSMTTLGNTNEPALSARIEQADVGVTYTLSEVAAGTADLGNYSTRYACRNYQSGGQTPSGVGTSFNVVLARGDDLVCTFYNTPPPTVNLSKRAEPVAGTPVLLGQLLTYTLAVEVLNGPTLSPVVLEDQLGDGLTFVEVTSPGAFTYNPATRTFTMPAGQPSGTYSVSYTASVDSDATVLVNNSVTGTGGGDPTNPTNPICAPGACVTEHPISLTASLVLGKRLPNGRVRDTDQFTLTIAQGSTTQTSATTTGTTTAPTQQASMTAVAIGVPYTLTEAASDTTVLGDYASRYECVNSLPGGQNPSGSGTSFNVTLAAGDDLVCTFINAVAPTVTVFKSASPFNGSKVQLGQLINYTLYTEVVNGPTLSPVVLTDQLGEGLSFVEVVIPGQYSHDPTAGTFTLPEGLPSGMYAVTYTARVDVDTEVLQVNNSVSGTGGGDPLNPTNPACDGICTTSHPIERTTVTVSKTSTPATGTPVEPGDTLSYTLKVDVVNGPTGSDVVLTDTLGAGLEFVEITSNTSGFVHDAAANTFTLPAGAASGDHIVTYTARVIAGATVAVNNSVEGTGGGTPTNPVDPECAPGECATTHPIVPAVLLSKTSTPATGTPVEPGDTLSYTLVVEVVNGPTQSDVVLTDTLGVGLVFDEVTDAGGFTYDPVNHEFILPAPAASGVYSVTYTAKVATNATVSVNNSVTGTGGGDPGNPTDPSCTPTGCETTHPIVPLPPGLVTPVPLGSVHWNALLAGFLVLLAVAGGRRRGRHA